MRSVTRPVGSAASSALMRTELPVSVNVTSPCTWLPLAGRMTALADGPVACGVVGSLAHRNSVNHKRKRGLAVFIGSQVAEIAGVTVGSAGRTVLVSLGVEVPARTHCIGCAAIAFLVNMKAMCPARQPCDLRR